MLSTIIIVKSILLVNNTTGQIDPYHIYCS
jgi:hypothetical protein